MQGFRSSKIHRCEAERCTVCPRITNLGISNLKYCKDHRILGLDLGRDDGIRRFMDCLKKLSRCVSETQIKRRTTQHGSLSSLLGDGDKGMEIAEGEGKNIFYWADYSSQGRTEISYTVRTSPQTN